MKSELQRGCPLSSFVRLVSGKWAIPILYRLILTDGAIRFRELQRRAEPITQKELTKHLRLLERRGLVRREIFDESPLRVEYSATQEARHLVGALGGVADWMRDYGWALADAEAKAPSSVGLPRQKINLGPDLTLTSRP
ncbi:MAG TPA: helix-turn-helix domain-containing protein [Steroidobacter sp.]|uniref:winged helix-turn-helix transcriptional regulator n=1 Tax=Steroidobacter sp. TaxID=1978227 RepID=UPI002EDB881F